MNWGIESLFKVVYSFDMNRKAETFFDDITKALAIEGESAHSADISHDTAVEFFADSPKETPPVNAMPTVIPIPSVVNIPQQVPPVVPESSASYHTPSGTPALTYGQVAEQIEQEDASESSTSLPEPAVPLIDPAVFPNMDMQTLQATAHNCTLCDLCRGRKNVVFGAGNIHADLMFIGEGPGHDEDIQGIPFVGESGQLLTKMINGMRFQRSDVYISNIVKCRPSNNRDPEDNEAAACRHYLKRQIELIAPTVIVVLGAVPLKYFLNKTGITKCRGGWDSYEGIKVMPTFHPAYLLRNPAAKKEVWEDLKKVMQIFGKTPVAVQKR